LQITQYPEFYNTDLQVVAVAPFKDRTEHPSVGEMISNRLADALGSHFTIVPPDKLKIFMSESDLNAAIGIGGVEKLQKLKTLSGAQAIIVGSVETYGTGMDDDGNFDGLVRVSVSMISTTDGTAICVFPAVCGYYSSKTDEDVLAKATSDAIREAAAKFAPSLREIRVQPGKTLRTAVKNSRDKWVYTEKFDAAGKLYVVVSLPESCDRNFFRVAVVRKGKSDELAAQEILWNRKNPELRIAFDVNEIVEKGGGPGEYEVLLCSGNQSAIRHGIRIR
jgi:hypothetical protein